MVADFGLVIAAEDVVESKVGRSTHMSALWLLLSDRTVFVVTVGNWDMKDVVERDYQRKSLG